MKKKKVFGALLAGALTLSLLPASALAITGADLSKELTEQWDYWMLLSNVDVEGAPTGYLIPSSFDAEHFRLVKAVKSTGSEAAMEYDSQGNVTKITYSFPEEDGTTGSVFQTWEYDSQGREVKHTDGGWGFVTETAYDSQGRVSQETVYMDDNPSDSVVMHYSYDSQGRLTEQRMENEGAPGLDTYSYEGDKLIKIEGISDGVKSESLFTYNDAGQLKEKTETRYDPAGNGTMKATESQTSYYAYDEAGRMVNLKSDRFDGDGKRNRSEEYQWTYFQDGKLSKQEYVFELLDEQGNPDLHEKNCEIHYDNAGRVSRVDASDATFRYTYDENENNTKIEVSDKEDGEITFTFTYEPVKAEAPAPAGPAAPAAFSDVPAGAWYAAPVAWAVEKNVTTGTSETIFSPDQSCTRAQVVTFLWRAMGQPQAFGAEAFTDVEKGSWYEDAVAWAVEKGITTGTSETTFSPDAPCTRGQVATFLWRALDKPEAMVGADLFTDVPEDAYFFQPVLWALDKGVTTGTGEGVFSPDDTCTRAQVVTFLYRALAE